MRVSSARHVRLSPQNAVERSRRSRSVCILLAPSPPYEAPKQLKAPPFFFLLQYEETHPLLPHRNPVIETPELPLAMAAMIISRRAHPVSTFLHALRLSAAAASSSRSFAADAGQETSVDVGRRPAPAPQRRRSAASPAPRRARARAGDLLPTFFSGTLSFFIPSPSPDPA